MDLLDLQERPPETLEEFQEDDEFEEEFEEETNEPHVYTVSELNGQIRQMLEGEFPLMWIQGEISNFKAHSSGHFYFSLKDEKCQVDAVMFRGFNSRLKFKPQSGQEVLVRGKVTVYEPRGNYQVFCEVMEPVGAGALQMAFEQLKKKLQKEGLFDEARKRPLPLLPKHIALVTSPTGAAVRDMLNVLGRRFKGVNITVIPVMVQGEKAAPSIVKGLQQANLLKDVDVIICGRGGGSIEDLWAFNEEIVARAIVASDIPVISAVGHEVDFTIADFVADLRAPTPSAAAELVIKNAEDLIESIKQLKLRLWRAIDSQMRHRLQQVHNLSKRLVDPQRRLQDLMIRCDELRTRLENSVWRYFQDCRRQVELAVKKLGRPQERIINARRNLELRQVKLQNAMSKTLELRQARWQRLSALLDSLSPLKVVERGYSITRKNNLVVKSINDVKVGDDIEVILSEGHIKAKVSACSKEKLNGL